MGEKIIKGLELIADYAGTVLIIAVAVIVALAVIRVIVKKIHGEKITVTPVGIANDLPDSVTGMNKYRDALDTDDEHERK